MRAAFIVNSFTSHSLIQTRNRIFSLGTDAIIVCHARAGQGPPLDPASRANGTNLLTILQIGRTSVSLIFPDREYSGNLLHCALTIAWGCRSAPSIDKVAGSA
jgi:hypothetical protein